MATYPGLTIEEARSVAYDAQEKASRAYHKALKEGADDRRLARLREAADDAYADYRRLVEEMTEAAIAGVYD